jgi:hypothetical protein
MVNPVYLIAKINVRPFAGYLVAVLVVFLSPPIAAEGFVWRTESMHAEIEVYSKSPYFYKYLHLTQKLRLNESGWTMMKIEIPSHWDVTTLSLEAGCLTLTSSDGTSYVLTKENVGQLSFEILDGGDKRDDQLKALWDKYAKPRANLCL